LFKKIKVRLKISSYNCKKLNQFFFNNKTYLSWLKENKKEHKLAFKTKLKTANKHNKTTQSQPNTTKWKETVTNLIPQQSKSLTNFIPHHESYITMKEEMNRCFKQTIAPKTISYIIHPQKKLRQFGITSYMDNNLFILSSIWLCFVKLDSSYRFMNKRRALLYIANQFVTNISRTTCLVFWLTASLTFLLPFN
jgi:hypothetical protein